jgi:AraC-like DNA-binding protein
MLLKFPVLDAKKRGYFLQSDIQSFARYSQSLTSGKRAFFLTENTLLYVLQGRKEMHFRDYTISAEVGQLIMIKRGIYGLSEFRNEGEQYEVLLLFFTDELLRKFLHKYNLSPAAGVPESPTHLVLPTNSLLEDFKNQYMGYFRQQVDGLEEVLQLKLQELFLLLLAGPQKQQVQAFLQSIAYAAPLDIAYTVKTHLFQPLTLEELARLSGRSLASFKRDFQHHFHSSPKKWINEQRLAHAKVLLEHTDKQVTEIALDCGFENVSHFIRIFKQQHGVTPSAVRAKNAIV